MSDLVLRVLTYYVLDMNIQEMSAHHILFFSLAHTQHTKFLCSVEPTLCCCFY